MYTMAPHALANKEAVAIVFSWIRKFDFLTMNDLDMILPHLQYQEVPAKASILNAGQVCDQLCFVVSGAFRLFYARNDKEVNLRFFLAEDFAIDFQSMINRIPSKHSIQAMQKSVVVTLKYEKIHNIYMRSTNWERFTRQLLEKAYTHELDWSAALLSLSGPERYQYLLRTRPDIFESVPLYHIATYLGMQKESLSRLRSDLKKAKILSKKSLRLKHSQRQ